MVKYRTWCLYFRRHGRARGKRHRYLRKNIMRITLSCFATNYIKIKGRYSAIFKLHSQFKTLVLMLIATSILYGICSRISHKRELFYLFLRSFPDDIVYQYPNFANYVFWFSFLKRLPFTAPDYSWSDTDQRETTLYSSHAFTLRGWL